MNDSRGYYRYLPVYPEIEDWGCKVLDVGYTRVPPMTVYPAPGHPEDHHFSWEHGRRLKAFTFVYITTGAGVFDSSESGEVRLEGGEVFVVFPGVWHRYRPDPQTGWDEYWVECEGPLLEKSVERMQLKPANPVLKVGHDEALLREFLNIMETIGKELPGFLAVAGAQSLVIVAMIRSLAKMAQEKGVTTRGKLVRHAIVLMRERLGSAVDWNELASRLGVSYSSFRRSFRAETGRSPGDYFIEMKINRAKQLLVLPASTVQGVSQMLGFESASYFSHQFKTRTGMSPSHFRNAG